MKGLKVLKKDRWCCQNIFFLRFCEIGQFHRPWSMSNNILLQILKIWHFVFKNRNCELKKKNFDWCQNLFFIDVRIRFFIQTLLLKGLHKYSLEICELFWDVKMENGVFGQIQKILDTKRARILKHNCKYVFITYPSTKLKEKILYCGI